MLLKIKCLHCQTYMSYIFILKQSSLVVEQPVEIQTEISNPFASKLDAAAIDGG